MSKQRIAVMDIGSEMITLAVATPTFKKNFVLNALCEQAFDGYMESEFLQEDNLQESISLVIKKAEDESKIEIKDLYVSVASSFCFYKSVKLNVNFSKAKKVDNKVLNKIIEDNLHKYKIENKILIYNQIKDCLIEGESVFTDEKPFVAETFQIVLSLVFVDNKCIDTLNAVFKQLGISSVNYISRDIAKKQYLLNNETNGVVVDIDFLDTSLCIIKNNKIVDIKTFAVGGAHISVDFMECFKLSYLSSLKLKDMLTLSIQSLEDEKYEVDDNGEKIEVDKALADKIAVARIQYISEFCNFCLAEHKDENTIFYVTGSGLNHISGAVNCLKKHLGCVVCEVRPKQLLFSKPKYSNVFSLLDSAIEQNIKKK